MDSGWDMSSILTRAEMVKSVSAQDNATLEELMNKMQEIEKERQALAQKKIELDEDKKTLDVQKAELQSSIDEISSSKSELDAEIAECNAAIRKLDSQTSEIRETIDTDQKRIREIENEIKGAANASAQADLIIRAPADYLILQATERFLQAIQTTKVVHITAE